jgi:hypothetical protein
MICILTNRRENKMSKLHHTKYKENYKKYILGTIETGINDEPLKTDQEKIKYIFDRFNSEYGFMIDRVGKQKAIAEWLSGLALDIEYYYDDIVDLAVKMGSIDPNPSDKLRSEVIKNYWSFMAYIIMSFEPKELKQ